MPATSVFLAAAAGLLVGSLLAWLLASARRSRSEALLATERETRQTLGQELQAERARSAERDRELAVAQERALRGQERLEEQKSFLDRSRKELEDAFKGLAAAALRGNTEQFLALAEQKLATTRAHAAADLEERKKGIENLLAPLKETLGKLDQKTADIERARVDAYSRIDEQVRMLARTTQTLQEKTTSLASALRGSQVRGRWGEVALRNIAELAGMSEHCDFEEQETAGDGRRPDMTVRLPGDRRRLIAVDAKAPLAAYLEAHEATDDATRRSALARHVRDLRGHVRALAARDYAASLDADIDLVVMFLPGDPFLGAAFEQDPDLQIEALRSKVLIATPSTLVALLRTVAIYWQQRAMAENAETIAATARELYERAAKFGEELGSVGKGLDSAVRAFNRAVGSFERRLLPMGNRLDQLKVSEQTKRALSAPEPIEETPRRPADTGVEED